MLTSEQIDKGVYVSPSQRINVVVAPPSKDNEENFDFISFQTLLPISKPSSPLRWGQNYKQGTAVLFHPNHDGRTAL